MGVLVVEDRTDVHGIPLQISNMSELVLAIQVKGKVHDRLRIIHVRSPRGNYNLLADRDYCTTCPCDAKLVL